MIINRACELKGQFNTDGQLCVYRTMVQVIWEVRNSEGQIIRAILYWPKCCCGQKKLWQSETSTMCTSLAVIQLYIGVC